MVRTKVSLSTVPTISKASQHNNNIAIPTCSGIMFQEGSFSDSLRAEPVIGTTNLGRSRNSKNRLGTSSTSSALPSVRVSQNVKPSGICIRRYRIAAGFHWLTIHL